MSDWLVALHDRLACETAVVRVLVAGVRGSAPREPGACMLVGASGVQDSIGGGNLEFKAIEIARGMLAQPADVSPRLDRFALGATLGQCCGGAVNLWFERYSTADRGFLRSALEARRDAENALMVTRVDTSQPPSRAIWTRTGGISDVLHAHRLDSLAPELSAAMTGNAAAPRARVVDLGHEAGTWLVERIDSPGTPLWLFGAGHVGRALVGSLADLPFRITWIDNREDAFPAHLPGNVTALHSDSPADEIARAPGSAYFLVLTHSHDIDYQVCRALLRRGEFAWAGLIGSETKATCFALRLARDDVPSDRIARLVSPIGIAGIDSKLPAAIAISVAAQLLQAVQSAGAQAGSNQSATADPTASAHAGSRA
jgi:xanthine dehydrogenase accessory factor